MVGVSPRLSAALSIAFVALGFANCFFIAWDAIPALPATVALAGLGFAVPLAWLARRVARLPQHGDRPAEPGSRRALVLIVALGVVLRIAWVVAFPPQQFSDGADYVRLARGIAERGEYRDEGVTPHLALRAFRPPGYAAFLAGFHAILGDRPSIPALANLLLFAGTAILLHHLGVRLSGPRAGRLAAFLLAVWPSNVMVAGLAFSETLSLFLYLAFYACWLRLLERGVAWAPALGLAGALSAFVRPTLLLLPLLLGAVAVLLRPSPGRQLLRAVAAGVVMAALIAPWTIRNHRVLGGFVPISTNGGDVFYRANNPLATGNWTERGELDPWQFANDEVGWNRAAFRLGKEWVAKNPLAFAKLCVKKQAMLLGSERFGPYAGLLRGCGIAGSPHDLALAVCEAAWAALWFLAVLGAVRTRDSFCRTPAGVAAILMIFLLVAAHSVFESQPRHHVPFFGHLVLLAALLFHPPPRERGEATAPVG